MNPIRSNQKIAILDCNNYYVSCERMFQPKYDKTPTAVLSNNDGCFIARSQEVKDMGIKMGQPKFQLEETTQKEIKMFSSNYALYGDISDRITNILKRLVPKVEVYSIDESFLDLSHIPTENLQDELHKIKSTVQKLTGIPVSIGVAPTKTLAKLCNHISKTNKDFEGKCSYWHINQDLIHNLPIDEVWGIGRKYKKRLELLKVKSVKDFINMDPNSVKKSLHVTGLRTWLELNEMVTSPISTKFRKPKQICCSRSFGTTVWEPIQIKNAFWTFLKTTHKKMRKENLSSKKITIFATTNRFDENYFVWSISLNLPEQMTNLDTLWNQILPYLNEMPVRLYYKAGIVLSNLSSDKVKQSNIFDIDQTPKEKPEVEHQKWQTRRELISAEYTTNWNDLPVAY